MASRLIDAPVALVSLVREDEQVFASQVGLAEPWASRGRTPLSHSFCQHAVVSGEPLIVEDAREHPLVRENEAIRDLGVIAYAGIPLIVGHECVGSFCVIDSSPRSWGVVEVAVLRDLAAMVVTELELRLAVVELEAAHGEALRTQDRFRVLIESMPEGVVLRGAENTVLASNRSAERMLGLTADQISGRAPRDPRWRAVEEDGTSSAEWDRPAIETLRTGRPVRDVMVGARHADGTLRWISIDTEPLPSDPLEGGPLVLCTLTDVTERRAADVAIRRDAAEHAALSRVATLVASGAAPADVFAAVAEEAARVFEAQAAGVARGSADGGATVVGVWAEEGLERPRLGTPVALDAETAVAEALRTDRPSRVEHRNPATRPYRCGIASPVWVGGELWGAVTVAATDILSFDDAAAVRLARFSGLVALAVTGAEARARLVDLATTDDLTGLANLRAFRDRLDQEVRRASRHARPLSLVMLDVDHFKAINDLHGHPVGDRVLQAVAHRLDGLARGEELVARVGGEEFAWILPETGAREAVLAADRAVNAMRAHLLASIGSVTISAGVCELGPGASAADLVAGADRALYAAKAAGRDRVSEGG